jgi:hypothetical protein
MHLKQGDYRGLKRAVDYYIDRQVENGEWPEIREEKKRYLDLLERTTLAFARAAAQFENEYIFCWLEWDGDNILADAGIIDYGSVRQFGLFHHDYRYDDVDRFSTTITEQKNKAKYLIQTFAQQTDFLITGKKRNLGRFKQHPSVKKFLIAFEAAKDEGMLYRIGFDRDTSDLLLGSRQDRRTVRRFRTLVRYFENVRTRRGRHPVADGITWDAIFCVRDILRELPLILLERNKQCSPDEFIGILRSEYATKSDLRIGAGRKRKIREFQEVYSHLIRRAARLKRVGPDKILTTVSGRSQLINRYSRLTGQSAILVSKRIVRESKRLSANSINRMMHEFITEQVLRPEARASVLRPSGSNRLHETRSALKALHETVKECRDSI